MGLGKLYPMSMAPTMAAAPVAPMTPAMPTAPVAAPVVRPQGLGGIATPFAPPSRDAARATMQSHAALQESLATWAADMEDMRTRQAAWNAGQGARDETSLMNKLLMSDNILRRSAGERPGGLATTLSGSALDNAIARARGRGTMQADQFNAALARLRAQGRIG